MKQNKLDYSKEMMIFSSLLITILLKVQIVKRQQKYNLT